MPIDGPLVGGTLFFDSNKNGVLDFVDVDGDTYQDPSELSEPVIPELGKGLFALNVPSEFDANGNGYIDMEDGQLAIAGALDTSTGLELQTPLTAPFGSAIVSPLTTLASELVNRYDKSLNESADLVLQAVGVSVDDSGFRLYIDDPIIDAAQGETDAARAFAQGAMVHNSVDQIAGYLSGLVGGPSERTAGAAVYAVLANLVANGDPLLLDNPYLVASIAAGAASSLGIDIPSDDLPYLGEVIAEGNHQITMLARKLTCHFSSQSRPCRRYLRGKSLNS